MNAPHPKNAPPQALEWPCTPEELLAGWPRDRRLVALLSGPDPAAAGRWCLFSEPSSRVCLGSRATPEHLRDLLKPTSPPHPRHPDHPPFRSGWIGRIAYEFGSLIEPAARPSQALPKPEDLSMWPVAEFHRCDWVIAYDRLHSRWWFVGDPDAAVPPLSPAPRAPFAAGPFDPRSTLGNYIDNVQRARAFIHAGDCYQVNLTHALRGAFSGSARSFFLSLCDHARPLFGTYQESDDLGARRVLASASPELFLEFHASSRTVTTRPMKGTRADITLAAELRDDLKERAELNMIIDLMRNDLGRVCDLGSVTVSSPRTVETHGSAEASILQATATVVGTLRSELNAVDLLLATFPGGSITGAPKIRAMRIIAELENSIRGQYCGAHGFFDDDGSCTLGMSIRSALITGGLSTPLDHFDEATVHYGVGAGIVADSDPEREWIETLDKARILHAASTSHAQPSL